jgi:cold shock CspA family protein/ribosome-associated translation inhibitor RaiA
MDIPLEVSFHNIAPSDALKTAIRQHVDRLERHCGHIIGCRVVVEIPHKHHRIGSKTPDVHVVVHVPGREIVVSRELVHAGNGKTAVNAYSLLNDAFKVVEQRLKDHRRQVQGEVKPKDVPERGHIAELVAERKYGFIATEDGEQIYFHRNSVADNGFEKLKIGDTVEYAALMSDRGNAATRVWRTGEANQVDQVFEENKARSAG